MNREAATDFDRMVDELQQEIVERERQLYLATVLREVSNPKNVGSIPGADLHGAVQGWCGDTMEIFVRLDGDVQRFEQIDLVTGE